MQTKPSLVRAYQGFFGTRQQRRHVAVLHRGLAWAQGVSVRCGAVLRKAIAVLATGAQCSLLPQIRPGPRRLTLLPCKWLNHSGPLPVLVMSLLFIASVFMLHIWAKFTR